MKHKLATILVIAALAGCSDADVASRNLSRAAENFEVNRRIVFYNGITGEYILVNHPRLSQDPRFRQGRKQNPRRAGGIREILPGRI